MNVTNRPRSHSHRYSLLRSKANPAASSTHQLPSPTVSPSPLSSLSSPPAPTSLSLTSHIPPARYYKLHESILPPFHQMLTFDDEKVSTALGYAVLCVSLISKWYSEQTSGTHAHSNEANGASHSHVRPARFSATSLAIHIAMCLRYLVWLCKVCLTTPLPTGTLRQPQCSMGRV